MRMKSWILLFIGWAATMGALAKPLQVDNVQLADLLAQGVPLVDIRTEREWRETGVVPGSILLTFFNERGNYDAKVWLEDLRQQLDPQAPLILICRSGNRTGTISRFLSDKVGLPKVYNVQRGIRPWLAEKRPIATYPPTP